MYSRDVYVYISICMYICLSISLSVFFSLPLSFHISPSMFSARSHPLYLCYIQSMCVEIGLFSCSIFEHHQISGSTRAQGLDRDFLLDSKGSKCSFGLEVSWAFVLGCNVSKQANAYPDNTQSSSEFEGPEVKGRKRVENEVPLSILHYNTGEMQSDPSWV